MRRNMARTSSTQPRRQESSTSSGARWTITKTSTSFILTANTKVCNCPITLPTRTFFFSTDHLMRYSRSVLESFRYSPLDPLLHILLLFRGLILMVLWLMVLTHLRLVPELDNAYDRGMCYWETPCVFANHWFVVDFSQFLKKDKEGKFYLDIPIPSDTPVHYFDGGEVGLWVNITRRIRTATLWPFVPFVSDASALGVDHLSVKVVPILLDTPKYSGQHTRRYPLSATVLTQYLNQRPACRRRERTYLNARLCEHHYAGDRHPCSGEWSHRGAVLDSRV